MSMFFVTARDEFGCTYAQVRKARTMAVAISGLASMVETDNGPAVIEARAVNVDSVRSDLY